VDSREYHVASFVVSTLAENGAQIAEHIDSMPGLEVHVEQQGKLVVTAEASDVRKLADLTARLEVLDSVIAVAPIYHEYETAGESVALTPHEKQ
jgi:nitrate reductase NapD